MPSGHESTAEPTPYFFLSYAHSHGLTLDDDFRRDRRVKRFHDDLRDKVRELAHSPGSMVVSAVDSEIPIGGLWPERISKGLARCSCFVALYSDDYFNSEHCGKEWQAFASRLDTDQILRGRRPEAVIPVVWRPVHEDALPACAGSVQYSRLELSPAYRDKGLGYLLRHMPEHRAEYEAVVEHLALQIVHVAERGSPSPAEHSFDYRDLANAFRRTGGPAIPRPRIRIVIAAPSRPRLPRGCETEMYGDNPVHWRPYLPDFEGEIAVTARRLAESMDFQAFVEILERSSELRTGNAPSAPTVLIVDPWAAQVPELQQRLSAFDESSDSKLWIRPVVVWNRGHPAGARHEADLESTLHSTLSNCRRNYRPDSPQVLDGLETVQDFLREMRAVIQKAEQLYFSEIARGRRYDAATTSRLPRIGGPGPGLGFSPPGRGRDAQERPDGKSDVGPDDNWEQR